MKIHKEGNPTILIVLVFISTIWLIINYYFPFQSWYHLAVYIATLAFLAMISLFFRLPRRKIEMDENMIFCPADGKIVVIEEVFEPEYFNDKRIQVSVFMSPLNVHVNWFPVSGVVKLFKYRKGKHLVAFHPKSSTENERTTLVIESSKGKIMVRQIAGAIARRIVCKVKEEQKALQGGEFGIIKFGSRVDIFLPLTAKVNVKLNEAVKGKKCVIAFFE
jgi:phosphatidylserine decarboxylase